jgi:uncharacterized membrane protein YjdF
MSFYREGLNPTDVYINDTGIVHWRYDIYSENHTCAMISFPLYRSFYDITAKFNFVRLLMHWNYVQGPKWNGANTNKFHEAAHYWFGKCISSVASKRGERRYRHKTIN